MATLPVASPTFRSVWARADDGTQLHALQLGNGPQTVVYCLPHPADPELLLGTPALAALAARVAADHTLLVPAPRGSGRSERRGPFGVGRLAADIAALLEACGRGSALVWGRRLGGVPALALARRFPERVTGVVLDNLIVHPALAALFGGVPSRWDALPPAEREAATVAAVGAAFRSHFAGVHPPRLEPFLARVLASAPLEVWADSLRDALQVLLTPERALPLYRVQQPLLLLAAPTGVVPGERAQFTMLRRLAPQATLRAHPAAAAAHHNNADAVYPVVMDWWRAAGPEPPATA